MKLKYLYILIAATLAYSCDDTTNGIGDSTIAANDSIPTGAAQYYVQTKSIIADSVYARTSTAYLGKYTDPQFGEFSADFIAQFNCNDNFEFPKTLQEITGVKLRMYYGTYFGDSQNAMRLQVDTLNKVIPEEELSTFYTSVDPYQYCNPQSKPLARKAFAAEGTSAQDTVYTSYDSYGYSTSIRYFWQDVKLPLSFGKHMYDKYLEDKNNYKDAESFIKNVLKGFYIHCTHGDGTILYIDEIQLQLGFKYLIESSSGKTDSIVNGITAFAATKEVIQANRFRNSERLEELTKEGNHTYLKSPAGIFTEVSLPIEEIAERHLRDTLNAVSITFTKYNEKNHEYSMGTPDYLLMVRKADMYKFFENNKLHDNKTSFLTKFVSSGELANTYSFPNIAPLISHCMHESAEEKSKKEWNQVVLIPVKTETDSNGNIIGIKNSLDMESARLVGGENNQLPMQVLYSRF